jgi:hypothetical protein
VRTETALARFSAPSLTACRRTRKIIFATTVDGGLFQV